MKIAQLRKAKGLTQSQLAAQCDTTQQQIARIETGAVDPRVSTVRRIAAALGCEPGELFYTRDEFLETLRAVAAQRAAATGQIPALLELNAWCARERQLPSFDPLWEQVVIVEGEVVWDSGHR